MRIGILLLGLAWTVLPLLAEGTNAAPTSPIQPSGEDFGQYLADHQDDLAPFFQKNAEDLVKAAVPLVMGLAGWIVFLTMLVGWGIDVLMSRGFAFFFAPAYAEWKRSAVYASGRLFLSLVYTCLMGLAIVFCLGLTHAGIIILSAIVVLMFVSLAAQLVWVLYMYRTHFGIAVLFYVAVIVVHSFAGLLLTGPLLGSRASGTVTKFVDAAITPRLNAEVESTRHELMKVKADRDSIHAKTSEVSNQINQAQAEKDRLGQEIEEKKSSDIYVLAQIIKVRANGDLASAHDQLAAFPAKFPSSSLNPLAQSQLADVNNQIAAAAVREKQQESEQAAAAAQARADLLNKAARGEVTLSEMRQALINKSRAQVKDLLGPPNDTGPDSWGYRQRMILNPLTSERHGLIVNFSEGLVQGVDYDHQGGTQ